MVRLRENFQHGTLTAQLLIGGTTLDSAELASLQAVTAPDIAVLVLDPAGDDGAPEIVHVTAHTGAATTATILRAQEGTTARQHEIATVWKHSPTADDFGLKLASFTYIAQGTTLYTLPAGVTAILVECIGGGGGGGGTSGATSNSAAAAGGGGGAYSREWITAPDASYACVVGAGGAGGTAGANAGTVGADTTFGSPSVCTALGGGGGAAMAAGTAVTIAQATDGGAVSGISDFEVSGGTSGPGIRLSGTVGAAGNGGSGGYGAGGGIGRAHAGGGAGTGEPGKPFGSGGAGALSVGVGNNAGGPGANGLIIVWEFE